MKKTLFIAALLFAFCGVSSPANGDLLITGVFDGPLTGGIPKVVELYSIGSTDLSQYGVGSANNGGGTDGVELQLSGTAADGEFIYIVDGTTEFASYFAGQLPSGVQVFDGSFANGGAAAVNGDDAVELFFDASGAFAGAETVTDVFGDISASGTGTPWHYLDGWAYRIDETGPDGSAFTIGNWTFSGINVNDGQTDNTSAPTPFPIGTYSFNAVPEPGSAAIIGLFGISALLRRRK